MQIKASSQKREREDEGASAIVETKSQIKPITNK